MNSEGEKIVKIVEFETYCPICKYFQKKEAVDTCHYCLQIPLNMCSNKPINFKEKR